MYFIFYFLFLDLEPYKYAGYKQLIKTIRLEASDEQLFSKGNMLLAAASELAYHTVNCSALNAEELNREQGFIVSKINELLHFILHLYFKILSII